MANCLAMHPRKMDQGGLTEMLKRMM
jgi:hypothetical protein